MTQLQYRSPIEFPAGWERTPSGSAMIDRTFAQNMTINDALRYLQDEIKLLPVSSATVYSNYDSLDNDYRRSKKGNSEGVSLRLHIGEVKAFIACDKWQQVTQNIYALHLAVRHFRLYEEWGIATTDFMLGLFDTRRTRRTTDMSVSDNELPEWMQLLGLGPTATLQDANAMYRHRAKLISHDEAELIKLNQAIEQARNYLK